MFRGKARYLCDEDGNPDEEIVLCADDCSICTITSCPYDEEDATLRDDGNA